MIDFTKYKTKKKTYGGANGSKISISFNDSTYMIKLPTHALKNSNVSYSNSAISEYLGCHIFNLLGIKAQETILGTYMYHNKERVVVACKDFVEIGYQLVDFASLKNQIIDSNSNGYGTELDDILETIEKQTLIDHKTLSDFFWDLFVIDALIGNWDRHNGNWGFLYNPLNDSLSIAPVFDCGSCLYPQIDEDLIKKVLLSKKEQNARVYDFPTSAIVKNGKRINYFEIISSHKYKNLDLAICKMRKKIDFEKINALIDDVPILSNAHKQFLKHMVKLRFDIFFK